MNQEPTDIRHNDSRNRKRTASSSISHSLTSIASLSPAPSSHVAFSTSSTDCDVCHQKSNGVLGATGVSAILPQSYSTGMKHSNFAIEPVAAAAPAMAGCVPKFPADPWGLYGGNIAAACEAANEEVVRKRSEGAAEHEDEERKRQKASSRLTAWQSRERKRIEMEVLQDRQTQLIQRNGDLRSENEQLRRIIQRLKPIMLTPPTQHQLTLAAGGLIQIPGGPPEANRAVNIEGRVDSYVAVGNDSGRYPSRSIGFMGHGPPLSIPFHQQSQEPHVPLPLQHTIQTSHLFPYPGSVRPKDLPVIQHQEVLHPLFQHQQLYQLHQQQQQQLQQQHIRQQNLMGIFAATQGISMYNLLGLNELVSPLARHQSFEQRRRHDHTEEQKQQSIPEESPTTPDSALHHLPGGLPLDLSSMVAPPRDLQANAPLLRAFPKRKEPQDAKQVDDGGNAAGTIFETQSSTDTGTAGVPGSSRPPLASSDQMQQEQTDQAQRIHS